MSQGLLRRHRGSVLIGAGLLLALVVAVLVAGRPATGTPMDPDNPGPDGARALARVLAEQGVEVDVARGADALDAAGVDADTTVLVVDPDQLGDSTVGRLLSAAGTAPIVVVGAGPGATTALGEIGAPSRVSAGDGVDADCPDPVFAGLSLEVDSAYAYPGRGCFDTPQGRLLSDRRTGVTLFGADQALTNDQVLRGDNAAIGLRLLGRTDRLVWYVPSYTDLAGEDGVGLAGLIPPWVRPALVLGLVALVGLLLWRVRRLGPLAVEPLPVVVRAIETTRSRGRLYRRSGDRAHAAEALRRAARTRIAERLRLGSTADPASLVRETARHLGVREADLAPLISPDAPPPGSDADLVTLARQLAELDREVRSR